MSDVTDCQRWAVYTTQAIRKGQDPRLEVTLVTLSATLLPNSPHQGSNHDTVVVEVWRHNEEQYGAGIQMGSIAHPRSVNR